MSTYDISNLINFRLIYLIFPNCDALRHELTWIERIFTDTFYPRASVQSVFHSIPSAFICVHLRLIFVSLSDRIREIQNNLFPQSSTIPAITYEAVAASRFRTRMTRIARIFTDTFNPCASVSSAQSVFHPKNPNNHASAFICVHLRLINRLELSNPWRCRL